MLKSKSIQQIEQRMASIEPGSLRYQALESAKNFKSSWIALGSVLYTVYKDKAFKGWGYMTFEAYCKTELGIQQQTASKLLHSYYFLEKNEPDFLRSVHAAGEMNPKNIPSADAVNILRLAAGRKELSQEDYQEFKKGIFEEGKDAKEVKREVGLKLQSLREEEDPAKARAERRTRTVHRLIATVKTLQKELVHGRLITDRTARELEKVLADLEKELGEETHKKRIPA